MCRVGREELREELGMRPESGSRIVSRALPVSAHMLVLVLVGCLKPAPEGVIVPELVGLSLPVAGSTILDAGLTINTPSLQHSDSVATDHVIAQTPEAGTSVPPSTVVSLVVSLGPSVPTGDELSVPNVGMAAGTSDSPSATGSGD